MNNFCRAHRFSPKIKCMQFLLYTNKAQHIQYEKLFYKIGNERKKKLCNFYLIRLLLFELDEIFVMWSNIFQSNIKPKAYYALYTSKNHKRFSIYVYTVHGTYTRYERLLSN